jgi:hypothetical protein
MPDFDLVNTALVNRYTAAAITAAGGPPAGGYDNIRVATGDLPGQMVPLPAVLVFPNAGTFDYITNDIAGDHEFIIRFYYNQTGDLERDMVALRKWLTILVNQLQGAVQLGGVAGVHWARITGWTIAILPYAGQEYTGIELTASIGTNERWQPTS